jgi:hypothetical protein
MSEGSNPPPGTASGHPTTPATTGWVRPFSTWRHVATGSTYTALGVARCSTNGPRENLELSVVYVSHTYGDLHYREVNEFMDGRFVPCEPPAGTPT